MKSFIFTFIFISIVFGAFSTHVFCDQNIPQVEPTEPERLTFQVRKAEIVDRMPLIEEIPETVNRVRMLALTIELINNTSTRKLDLTDGYGISVKDEFGNFYRQYISFDPNDIHVETVTEHFPSLYPGEVYAQTLFFEPLLDISDSLIVHIDPSGLGVNQPVQLEYPKAFVHKFTPPPDPIFLPRDPSDDDLKITFPQEGASVQPGDVINFKVQLADDVKRPEMIYLLSPIFVVEDPYLAYHYDVRIPQNQDSGPFEIAVMAKWQTSSDEIIVSKSVTLEVVNPLRE